MSLKKIIEELNIDPENIGLRSYSFGSEKEKIEAVRNYGSSIQYIQNPSEKVQLEAVRAYGVAIVWIQNPSEEVQLEAVKKDAYSIEYIQNPSEKVQLEAVKKIDRLYINITSEKAIRSFCEKYKMQNALE